MVKLVGDKELVSMRARIVETLVKWGDGEDYFVDQLKKKRRVTK